MWRGVVRLAAAAMMAGPGDARAQEVTDACVLVGREEFAALTGLAEAEDPDLMPWGAGTACGFHNGLVLLFNGPDGWGDLERLLGEFGHRDRPRTPVPGLGPRAFALLLRATNAREEHGAFVAFEAGGFALGVSVGTDRRVPPEATLPAAIAVAEAVAGKLE